MSHLGPEKVAKKFKGMVKRCADSGFDLAAEGRGRANGPLLHGRRCGGRRYAHGDGGLYVAGEDAGGAHGSNRLGGNGVANSTVYGGIAGDTMGAISGGMTLRDPDEDGA